MRTCIGFTSGSGHLVKKIGGDGIESTYGPHARVKDSREVVVKIAVKHMFKKPVCSLLRKLHRHLQVWHLH